MLSKCICIILILLLGSALLLLGSPVSLEEMLEKYSPVELVIGIVAVSAIVTLPMTAPFVLFPKVFE